MSNLQPNCCLEFDFQKVDQHAGGKWLIHDTKRRKDLLWEYRIQHGANGPLYVTSSYSTWIFCRGVSGFATDCPCGVWCRGLTTCLLPHTIVNRFRYLNNNITKDRCPIPLDTTFMLGPLKFNLQATIDHHGPSIDSGHYTASINCCKKHSIATITKFRSLQLLIKTPLLHSLNGANTTTLLLSSLICTGSL